MRVVAELDEQMGRLLAQRLQRLDDVLTLPEPAFGFGLRRPEQPAQVFSEFLNFPARVSVMFGH